MSVTGPIGDDELEGLFGRGDVPLALAVSGGADSMALMHLVARWAAREEVKAGWAEQWQYFRTTQRKGCPDLDWRGLATPSWLRGIDSWQELDGAGGPPLVVVLTVDHGLRPESAREAQFVADEARRVGMPCEILRWQGPKPATGIQEAARDARRDLMLDCLRGEFGRLLQLAGSRNLASAFERNLLQAHQQEDQAETVLMRLARGSGLEGLAGMRACRRATHGPTPERPLSFSTYVVRPMLDVPKQRLLDTLKAGGHAWVEDPSNEDERFERVRIRKALAALGEVGLTSEKIALSARRLAHADDSLRVLLDPRPDGSSITGLMAEVPLRSVWFASPYLAARSLRRLLPSYGGSAREPELAQLEVVATSLGNKRLDRANFAGVTLGGCKIEVVGEKRDRIRVYREGSGERLPVLPLAAGESFEWDGGRFVVDVPSWFKPGATLAALGMAGWAGLKRAVPELADLGWPAAAAATMPAVVRDGAVTDVPGLYGLLDQLGGEASPAFLSWKAHMAKLEQGVHTTFTYRGGW